MGTWVEWHERYEDPGSSQSARLAVVRDELRAALDELGAGALRVLSLCAGDGRDLCGVLPTHPRGGEVSGVLVERDETLAARGGAMLAELGLDGRLRYLVADAGRPARYAEGWPADLVLACGIFGNVSDADVERTVRSLPALCAPGAQVVWTRSRRAPDLTGRLRGWYAEAGFAERAFTALDVPTLATVGRHALAAAPPSGAVPEVLFEFA